MKRLISFGIIALALTAIIATQFVWATPPDDDGDHDKVAICHKGKVIVVDESAVSAHIGHGDCLAPAGASKGDDCECVSEVPCEDSEDCDGTCPSEFEVCQGFKEGGSCDRDIGDPGPGTCIGGPDDGLDCDEESDCAPGFFCDCVEI